MAKTMLCTFGPVKSTRYPELSYQRRGDHWRILDANGYTGDSDLMPGVGPMYGTQAELLADLDRYATSYGL